jgi:hypothetical protein
LIDALLQRGGKALGRQKAVRHDEASAGPKKAMRFSK